MNVKTYYSIRLLARIIDIFLVGVIVLVISKVSQYEISVLQSYFLYNILAIVFQGKTLGKYAFSLQIESEFTRIKQLPYLVLREILVFILLPVLFLNFICIAPVPLHDRISGTKVFKNEL